MTTRERFKLIGDRIIIDREVVAILVPGARHHTTLRFLVNRLITKANQAERDHEWEKEEN